jgi:hypothetical protein
MLQRPLRGSVRRCKLHKKKDINKHHNLLTKHIIINTETIHMNNRYPILATGLT